jgi:transketolase
MPNASQTELANAIRFLSMDAVEKAKSGHPGMPMGMADVATVLFGQFLKFDASAPDWADRDRFVLSAGHGSMLLYALLYLTGYPGMTIDEIKNFRQLHSLTPGHPEYRHTPGVETTTGPLGQGLTTAVGLALGERLMNARFGDELVDHYTYVIAGDGCLMEGVSHEAISLAGHLRLKKLVVLWDDNSISIDGATDLAVSDDQLMRFRASGWAAEQIDGHDPEQIAAALARAKESDRPTLIACKTIIGRGAPTKQGTHHTHGSPLGAAEIEGARAALNWPYPAFEVPEPILSAWRAIGARGKAEHQAWNAVLAKLGSEGRARWDAFVSGDLPASVGEAVIAHKQKLLADKPSLATRVSSQKALETLTPLMPALIGGSADLTGSNNTKTPVQSPINAHDFSGRYIHYGVREFAMGAVMNGLALHGGAIPYGGTFLVFSDYCRPAIRLSALMGLRVIYVLTHDSIGLGEDGPTHQPVEHLAALRAMPNLLVFRPADAIEAVECWQAALEQRATPSALALTRQNLPLLRTDADATNKSALGGYVLFEADGARDVTLLATGSEVAIAAKARDLLKEKGIRAAVVSLPCWELFDAQDEAYRSTVLGQAPRIAIEAGSTFGWQAYVASDADVIGMRSFGASAPIDALYAEFGITADAVVARAAALVK